MFDLIFPDVIRTFCVCERCAAMTPPPVFARSSDTDRVSENICKMGDAAAQVSLFATLRIARRFDMPVDLTNHVFRETNAEIESLEEGMENRLPHDVCILDHRLIIMLAQAYDEAIPDPDRPPSPSHEMDSHTPRDFFKHRTDVAMIATLLPVMSMSM